MMRHSILTLTCLMAGFLNCQADVLVNVRVLEPKILELDETYTIDLGDHFQLYGDPGPVATFSMDLPVQTGFQELLYDTDGNNVPNYDPDGRKHEVMTYELADGGTYSHQFDPAANAVNFATMDYSVQFQLLADQAPITVGNFIQYLSEDLYRNVIVHRLEIGILQFGRYRLADPEAEGYLLHEIAKKGFIPFEETIANSKGTLSMARGSSLDSAQSEFFINLVDNTEGLGSAYSVFGEVIDSGTSMPVLEQMGDAFVWDISPFFGDVFGTVPLYSPFYTEKASWLSVREISVPEGERSGVSYSFEFDDLDGEEGTSDDEAADIAAFDISINGSDLVISRNDSGIARLIIKGTFGEQERNMSIQISGYNADALAAFPASFIENDGILNSSWYGTMNAEAFPQVFHTNHGEQKVGVYYNEETFTVEHYIYDIGLNSWIYTTSIIYPYIYVYRTGHWLGYVTNTGNTETDIARYFYDFQAQEWIYSIGDGSTYELP